MPRARDPERQQGKRNNGKVSTSYRLLPETLDRVDAASDSLKLTKAQVVDSAIQEFAERRQIRVPVRRVSGGE